MDVAGVLGFIVAGIFTVLFVVTCLTAIRGRDQLMRDVTLIFSAIGAVFVLDVIKLLTGSTPAVLGIVGGLLFLAMPIFLLKLVADLRQVPRWLVPGAVVLLVAVIVVLVVGGRALPGLAATLLIAYFAGLEFVGAGYLGLEARRRRGASRARLAVAALATTGVAVAVLVVAGGAVVSDLAAVTGAAAETVALLAALAYGAAFLPPARLRRLWQATEAADYTRRLMAAPATEPTADLWARFVAAADAITGGTSFVLVSRPDGTSDVTVGETALGESTPSRYPTGAFAIVHRALGALGGPIPDGPIRADLVEPHERQVPVGHRPLRVRGADRDLSTRAALRRGRSRPARQPGRPDRHARGPPDVACRAGEPERSAGRDRRRAGGGQRRQERLPGQHEPRAADPAQRHHRLQ